MATHKPIAPHRLTKTQKKHILAFLNGEVSVTATATAMHITYQRVYTMASAILRHASSTGLINAEKLLKNY